jgi:hypothetical protein
VDASTEAPNVVTYVAKRTDSPAAFCSLRKCQQQHGHQPLIDPLIDGGYIQER